MGRSRGSEGVQNSVRSALLYGADMGIATTDVQSYKVG